MNLCYTSGVFGGQGQQLDLRTDESPVRAERLGDMAKKVLIEKIREMRHLKVRVEKLNKELKAYTEEIKGMMNVGDTVIVDDVKTICYEQSRPNLDRKALEAWLAEKGLEIPEEFIKTTVTKIVR